MSEFTASNGVRVENYTRSIDLTDGDGSEWLEPRQVDALREFFQHERDEELGRWRWPENPDYVVYPEEDGVANVVDETDGLSIMATRKGVTDFHDAFARAARAYFEAHPEPKPWRDAKPGELWVINIGDDAVNTNWQGVVASNDGRFLYRDGGSVSPAFDFIIDGRRIWPEDAS